jgi:hypothetical protein
MSYSDDYKLLRRLYNQKNDFISLPSNNFEIINLKFHSQDLSEFPDRNVASNENLKDVFLKKLSENSSASSRLVEIFEIPDNSIEENNSFKYPIFKELSAERSKDVIILLHGLNEKSWDKYLPWAKRLFELTGKSIILFPISFHINRAPLFWSHPRMMNVVSSLRTQLYPSNECSSFLNASISTRLHLKPLRFLWSGLKTVYDMMQLLQEIRSDKHPSFEKNAKIDFFGFSIGAFLSEILLMWNPHGMLDESKLFIFCGGPTIDRMSPVSRFIMDSEANRAVHAYYVNDFETEIQTDTRLLRFFERPDNPGTVFRSMLNYERLKPLRESKLKAICNRITSLSLSKDSVMTPKNVSDTLMGENHDIPVTAVSADFPYEYDHVNPFPIHNKIENEVNEAFEYVFQYASGYLS